MSIPSSVFKSSMSTRWTESYVGNHKQSCIQQSIQVAAISGVLVQVAAITSAPVQFGSALSTGGFFHL